MHAHLMPTELFVRRPLLWLTFAARKRATILCSPNFGYRHYLKVLGDRPVEGLDLSAVRLIFNGAEPISVELCDEFLTRLAPAQLSAPRHVPGVRTGRGLARREPSRRRARRSGPSPLNRHRMSVGERGRAGRPRATATRCAWCPRDAPFPTAGCASRTMTDANCPPGASATCTSAARTSRAATSRTRQPTPPRFTADGWLRTGDLGLMHGGELFISGRAKEIIFVNGQNYYPHDLEGIAQRAPGLELGKVVAAGVRPRGARDRAAGRVRAAPRRHGGVPAARRRRWRASSTSRPASKSRDVVPVKRIPKTTSGKIQRHLLEEGYVDGEFAAELAELAALRAAQRAPEPGSRTDDRGEAQEHLRRGAGGQARRRARQPVRDRRELTEAHRDPRADRPGISRARWT